MYKVENYSLSLHRPQGLKVQPGEPATGLSGHTLLLENNYCCLGAPPQSLSRCWDGAQQT